MINRDYINRNHPMLDAGVLSDRGIRKAVESGKIKTGIKLNDEQFQPNSLDLRIRGASVHSTLRSTQIDSDDFEIPILQSDNYYLRKNQPIDLPPSLSNTLYFAEKLKTDFGLRVDLRSGRARRGLMHYDDLVYEDEKGNIFIETSNQSPNTIRLYGMDRVAHAFFYTSKKDADGYIVSDKNELKDIASALSPDLEVDAPYIVLRAGDFVLIPKNVGLDDTRASQDIFTKEPLTANVFREQRHVVVQLNPKLTVPNNIGIQLLPSIPYTNNIYKNPRALNWLMHSYVIKGGWVESGYSGNVTAHLSIMNNFFYVQKDEPLVYALVSRYYQDVERPYASEKLQSHYQNSKGDNIKS